jgi:hypothetical protein
MAKKTLEPGDDNWPWYHIGIRPVAVVPLPEPPARDAVEVADDSDQAIDVSDWTEPEIWGCRVGRLCGGG